MLSLSPQFVNCISTLKANTLLFFVEKQTYNSVFVILPVVESTDIPLPRLIIQSSHRCVWFDFEPIYASSPVLPHLYFFPASGSLSGRQILDPVTSHHKINGKKESPPTKHIVKITNVTGITSCFDMMNINSGCKK